MPDDVWSFLAGGAGDEVTMRDNAEAFLRWQFRPRMLVDVAAVTAETESSGRRSRCRSSSRRRRCNQLLTPEGELATARAAAAAGTIMCVSTITSRTHAEIRDAAPGAPRWQQLYVLEDRGMTEEHLAEAVDCGYSAVVLTVDTPIWGRRERAVRSGFQVPADLPLPYVSRRRRQRAPQAPRTSRSRRSVTWRDVEWIAESAQLPVLVQGRPHRRGRGARGRARRRRRDRLEPRRPPARRRRGEPRRAAGGRRGGRPAASRC